MTPADVNSNQKPLPERLPAKIVDKKLSKNWKPDADCPVICCESAFPCLSGKVLSGCGFSGNCLFCSAERGRFHSSGSRFPGCTRRSSGLRTRSKKRKTGKRETSSLAEIVFGIETFEPQSCLFQEKKAPLGLKCQ